MIKANYRNYVGEFVIIENDTTCVVADADIANKDKSLEFGYVRVLTRDDSVPTGWSEILYWDAPEWREAGSEAFEAILGVIAKVAAGERVQKP